MASGGVGSSRGALAASVFELHKDENIYILVGQRGEYACSKAFSKNEHDCTGMFFFALSISGCENKSNDLLQFASKCRWSSYRAQLNINNRLFDFAESLNATGPKQMKNLVLNETGDDGGGGGGGGTFVFVLNAANAGTLSHFQLYRTYV